MIIGARSCQAKKKFVHILPKMESDDFYTIQNRNPKLQPNRPDILILILFMSWRMSAINEINENHPLVCICILLLYMYTVSKKFLQSFFIASSLFSLAHLILNLLQGNIII